ncbi:MAG: transcription elongation factor GreA [Candidatus Uhrbacteria bacterium]
MPTYISAEGLKKLIEESETRRTVTRKEIAQCISDAKELGDLSENFEYQDAKERQGSNEVRISELESMIKDAIVVEQQAGGDTIGLGTTFKAEANGVPRTFQIVGSNEAKPFEGKISNESPIGMAFIGGKVGEDISVEIPTGTMVYRITEIS